MTEEEQEIKELKEQIKEAEAALAVGGMKLVEQTNVELYLAQWKKNLKFLKKELKKSKQS